MDLFFLLFFFSLCLIQLLFWVTLLGYNPLAGQVIPLETGILPVSPNRTCPALWCLFLSLFSLQFLRCLQTSGRQRLSPFPNKYSQRPIHLAVICCSCGYWILFCQFVIYLFFPNYLLRKKKVMNVVLNLRLSGQHGVIYAYYVVLKWDLPFCENNSRSPHSRYGRLDSGSSSRPAILMTDSVLAHSRNSCGMVLWLIKSGK